jgi:putative spermidine/putrescine transport system substrate-binding protein
MIINRRTALTGSAATLGTLVTGFPSRGRAQGVQVVVGTWGGDYGNLLKQAIDDPLMKPLGIEVTQDVANMDPRRTKLISEKTSRRGSMDVACINDIDSYLLSEQGIFEGINEQMVPRTAAVLPVFKKAATIPHIYSVLVVLYNPSKISTPPKSYADMWDPKFKGRVGYSDILYSYNVAAATVGAGGQLNDFAPGKKQLLELKSHVKIYPSNEALAAALKSEEVWLTTMWLARGFMWKKAGIPVEGVIPEEGAIPVLFEAGVPKNSRNKESAWKYMNALLDPGAQVAFADHMGYVPTVKDAKLPDHLAKQISLTDNQQAKLKSLDYAYMQREQGATLDFWNKEFKT